MGVSGRVLAFLGVLAGAALPLAAQSRIITGQVTDSLTGDPVTGGLVTVRVTGATASIRRDGTFAVSSPAGTFLLQVSSLGFRGREVQVEAAQTVVEVALARDVFRLEEIVITGQATGISRQNLANAVATVSGDDLERVPAQSLEHALQGRVAGADIQTNSGAPGGGAQVRMRGVNSIIGSSAPLYVVDGVLVSDIAIPSNQNAVTRASGGSNPALTQDAQVNRIADINPNDIESIEILKGASASAIYGSKAANGVVIITTRRGQVGTPRFDLTQRWGYYALSNTIGSRVFETEAEAVDAFGASASAFYSSTPNNHERQLAGRRDLSGETSLSVSGGTEATRYFVSGLMRSDAGIIENTGFDKQSLRLNVDQQLGSRWNLSVNSNILHTTAQRGLTNNDNAGVSFFMVFPFTPNFINLERQADGTFPNNPFVESNPLQTAALMSNDEDVWRMLASGRAEFSALRTRSQTLRLIGTAGVDYFTQENALLFPPELQFEIAGGQPGTSLLSNSRNLSFTYNLSGVHTWRGASMAATSSAGVQYETTDLGTSRITSRNLSGGLSVVNAGTNVGVTQLLQRIEDLGFYLQEELLLADERLLVTGGIRADQSSANSDATELFFYPKASASYRFPDGAGMFDDLKFRLAWGQSGNRPLYGQRFTPVSPLQTIQGLPTLVVQGTVGAPDLHPERQTEIETGVDFTAFNRRMNAEFTLYQKNIRDLMLQRALAPSSGFATQIVNGGAMRTQGIELAVGLILAQRSSFDWLFRATLSHDESIITELDVPPFLAGGFGTALGAFRIEPNASATQIVGNDTLPDGSDVVRQLGDANPDFRMSFRNEFQIGSVNLYFLFDWQHGGDIINLTKLLYDFGQNTYDFDVIEADGQLRGARRLAGFGRQAGLFIEDGSFLKLRELTVTIDLPDGVRRLFGEAEHVRLLLSGRNLWTKTNYTGHDPEVSNFGNQNIARNIDVAPFPPSRSFWFGVNVGF